VPLWQPFPQRSYCWAFSIECLVTLWVCSSDTSLFVLDIDFSLCTLALAWCPPNIALWSSQWLCSSILSPHNFSSKVFNNLNVSPEFYDHSGVPSWHVLLLYSEEFRCVLLALTTKLPMFFCALLEKPKEPRTIFKTQWRWLNISSYRRWNFSHIYNIYKHTNNIHKIQIIHKHTMCRKNLFSLY